MVMTQQDVSEQRVGPKIKGTIIEFNKLCMYATLHTMAEIKDSLGVVNYSFSFRSFFIIFASHSEYSEITAGRGAF